MQAHKSRVTRGIPVGCYMKPCDNSGAKYVRLFMVKRHNTVKGRIQAAGVGDLVMVSVKKGKADVRGKPSYGIIVRQKKEYRRPDGTRIKFEDNSIVILKDDKGNPKGTQLQGPIAREACDRWPAIAKLASIIV
ncbi:50S ribosomal protein L14 [Candidatus Woesearchaeota archaeon]|nr:50S ribosomal protein L14 [Candidatus Woesearchaeota archaeon]